MPPKRKTKGKKRSRLSSAARGAKRRVRSAARYARRNPGRIAGGALGLGALGLGGYEAYLAAKRHGLKKGRTFTGAQGLQDAIEFEKFKRSNPYESPTGRFVRGVRDYPYRKRAGEAFTGVKNYDYRGAPGRVGRAGSGFLDFINPNRIKQRQFKIRQAQEDMLKKEMSERLYGKRRRRRRKKKKFGGCGGACGFGKKVKKPSAATRRMCKKLKVRLTTKRGGKRVYKSEAMLKKQCKKAMKRKSKK